MGYGLWCCNRVRPNLATKQQQSKGHGAGGQGRGGGDCKGHKEFGDDGYVYSFMLKVS